LVSGFRNYIGEKLLRDSNSAGPMKQPEGDIIISTFPKIIDSPDICETLIKVWSEDFWGPLNEKQKSNVDVVMQKSTEFIKKLYPVIYSEAFKYKESNPVESASGDGELFYKREELVKAALRFG
jgi:hypothetical protein